LELLARRLDPDGEGRAGIRAPVVRHAEDFLASLDGGLTYQTDLSGVARLDGVPFRDEPSDPVETLALLREAVETPGLNPAAPGHMGYIPGGGIYVSALADYLAAVSNRYAGVRFGGPGAVAMEEACLRWMADLVGYPADAGGNLASGGSIANLVAIVTAREAHGLKARHFDQAVVYLSGQTHHCVDKALRIAGMGEAVVRRVPLDGRYRMRPDALDALVEEDRAAGLTPWMVISSAGTTDTGAVDPLEAIARVASTQGLWHHVDAAYGGFFALVENTRPLLTGMAHSDSLVLDPHKGLFLPYGTGAVLVKDRAAMARAHAYHADYMQDARAADGLAPSPADLSPELTKHFRGLRVWLPLKLHGLAPFRACLEEKLLLTRWFHGRVAELGFEVGPEPDLSVSTYRWPAESPEAADDANRRLVRSIHEDGRVFVSSTILEGRVTLRMAALTFRTHLETVQLLLDVLEENVKGSGRNRSAP
jgi:glutamate/tyrosine decarboxylase-like PLP-dependent enzyme